VGTLIGEVRLLRREFFIRRRDRMKLTPPKQWVFFGSLFLTVIGVLSAFSRLVFLVEWSVWLVLAGYILLFLGNVFRGL